jgi:hypothetical protein
LSGKPSATSRRWLALSVTVFAFVAAVFLLAGLFSNFYTSTSVDVVLFLQGSIMGGYGLVAPTYVTLKGKQDESDLIYFSFLLGLIYSAGAVLMLVNAPIPIPLWQFSFTITSARLGYTVSIFAFLVFSAYYIRLRHRKSAGHKAKHESGLVKAD